MVILGSIHTIMIQIIQQPIQLDTMARDKEPWLPVWTEEVERIAHQVRVVGKSYMILKVKKRGLYPRFLFNLYYLKKQIY